MSNIQRALKSAPILWQAIAFSSSAETARFLRESWSFSDPTFGTRTLVCIAEALLAPEMTEHAAIADGWTSLEVARRRGRDLLNAVISEFLGQPGNLQKIAATPA